MPRSTGPRWSLPGEGFRFALFSMLAAFATYSCMYAFRKPFAAAVEFEDYSAFGVNYKVLAILAQVFGYTLSKFAGIKVVSEMDPRRRALTILLLIGTAQLALIGFGSAGRPWNLIFLFMNGLPLGMVWGLVFSFLEGRRFTELLGAGLCCSFIVSSGAVKYVGRVLIDVWGVDPFWMPAATGALFTPPLLAAVFMLSRIPDPAPGDQSLRAPRPRMNREDRKRFLRNNAKLVTCLVAIYALLNAYRDFRDNFAVELWRSLGHESEPELLALAEIPIAVLVFLASALLVLVRDNRLALRLSVATVLAGGVLLGSATLAFQAGSLDPAFWLVTAGFAMYLPYIAFHVAVYERLIAVLRQPANVGFLMYISDAFGYLGSVSILVVKDFAAPEWSWLSFFTTASLWVAALLILLFLVSALLLRRKRRAPQVAGGEFA